MSAYDLDTILKLSYDEHKVVATLHIAPCENPGSVTPDMVTAYLEGQGIRRQFMYPKDIAEICAEVGADPSVPRACVIARGSEPVNASKPEIVLDRELAEQIDRAERHKLDAQDASKNTDDDQPINFYEMSSIVIVVRGQRLAQIEQTTEPADGVDVFGQSIPASESATFDAIDPDSIQLKDNVCFARHSGEFVQTASSLRVNKNLEIQGDVDFSTGRIDFPGSVCIHGLIQDNFSVKSGKDLDIRSLVGRATLESLGSTFLARGMAGKDKGKIIAWGDLVAGYLESVHASIGGDVRVKGEITNSTLQIDGSLDAPNASIRGGEIVVAKDAVASTIGSEQGITTVLVLGTIPAIEVLTRQAGELEDKLESVIENREKKLGSFNAAIGKPNASQIEERMEMEFALHELRSRRGVLTNAHQSLSRLRSRHSKCSLNVKRAIYTKTELYLPGHRCVFERDIIGECTISLDRKGIPVIEYRGESKPLRDFAKVVSDERVLAADPDSIQNAA